MSLIYSAARLSADIRWIFKRAARKRYLGKKLDGDLILAEMPPHSFTVGRMFKGDQYQPHMLFGTGDNRKPGWIQGTRQNVVAAGIAMKNGDSNWKIAQTAGMDLGTVSRIRKAINLWRGFPMMCRCGLVGGHASRCLKINQS